MEKVKDLIKLTLGYAYVYKNEFILLFELVSKMN